MRALVCFGEEVSRVKPHRHIEHLLRLYFRDLPVMRRMAEDDLAITRKELARLQAEGPYRSLGTASYRQDAGYTAGRVSDTTSECAVGKQDKPEYYDAARKLQHTLAWLEEGLDEYTLLAQRVESVLTLLDADLRAALETMYRKGLRQCDLPVSLSASTVSYHLTYAYGCIDRCLQVRFYALPLEYLRAEHPQCFPGNQRAGARQRQGGLVLVS